MDDLVEFLVARVMAESHAYAYVVGTLGGEALLDSRLPMLDLIERLANDCKATDPTDPRPAGLTYALRVLDQAYAQRPAYQQAWRPWRFKETGPG
ncbi:DUF6221 family protein [Streptomyces halstedii]|uniref:Uncharacterized protein n=1 Tax=Streptomyces halstedii TaxID=1944 RepID=A0A6N9U589_STRHA|nr:hypothetical protein [Streptomyces halstedii]NEA17829.1 hypothetical protein [Streptomyces halstedii]